MARVAWLGGFGFFAFVVVVLYNGGVMVIQWSLHGFLVDCLRC